MGLSGPVPRRVDAATKLGLLVLVDEAVRSGWQHARVCRYLQLARSRAIRWQARRQAGRLDDQAPGGGAMHALTPIEREQILELFNTWGHIDRSHRKLAHRGSYLGQLWVSSSTMLRVLAAEGLVLLAPARAGPSHRTPFPEWATYTKNSIWIYDATHFQRCAGTSVVVIMDLVTRKWLTHVISGEETSTQVQVAFTQALEAEQLIDEVQARQDTAASAIPVDDPSRPLLLAVSDNGPQMTSGSTGEFMAMCAIAQHFGRPGTPTDQAWIESLFSHVKADWPHLEAINDPAILRQELDQVQHEYNTIRLHAGIGYVTPDDEHHGRGPAIRQARHHGLRAARRKRIEYHRKHNHKSGPRTPKDAD